MTARIRDWPRDATHVDLRRPELPVRAVEIAAAPQRLTVDLERTAIIVVDMQNDFCAAGGWLDSIGVDVSPARAAIAHLERILPALRDADVPVIWLNWGNRLDRANLPPNVLHVYDADGSGGGIGQPAGRSEAVLTRGSWGAAIVDELSPGPSDVHVDKFRMSGFFDTPLDSVLKARGIDTVLFAGVNADQCVAATLMDAACLGYDVVMVEGASATTSPAYCYDATVYNVRQCFGFTVTPDSLLEALRR
ncbi:cysteine hydrolase family protein [Microbacterium sp. Marseille-Q6965]|uniref:cysteine hydrolase family protein n=1 Tax=Microbacterium sp. Marseille-Q6965 TaxID=2965072 RepID=UPI0021B70393|nr:cysteine hydrolase [Microbacterium sp. Marseille-Q6965]